MANLALEVFKNTDMAKKWPMSSKEVLNQTLNFSTLKSFLG